MNSANTVRLLWRIADALSGLNLPTHTIAVDDDGMIECFWDIAEHHLEIELNDTLEPEVFYRNRNTDEYDFTTIVNNYISPEAVKLLVPFINKRQ